LVVLLDQSGQVERAGQACGAAANDQDVCFKSFAFRWYGEADVCVRLSVGLLESKPLDRRLEPVMVRRSSIACSLLQTDRNSGPSPPAAESPAGLGMTAKSKSDGER
jgi:hypothetical protein